MARPRPHVPADFADAAGAAEEGGPDLAGRRLDPAELLALARDPIPWVLPDFAARGYLTVLAGRGGEGKSLFTLAAASAVQAGGNVAGLAATTGTAALLDAENGPPLLGRRLAMLAPDDPIPAGLYDAAGIQLTDPVTVAALTSEITAEGYQLVALDSLRTLAPNVEESNGDQMAPLVVAIKNLARETAAAIVLITHRDKRLLGDYRGSSVLHDQADLLFVLEREDKDPHRSWRRRLRCSKARICEEPADRWLGLRVHRGELTITEAEPYEPEQRIPVRDDLADDLLDALQAAEQPLSRSELARRIGRGRDDGTVRRALEDLAERGAAIRERTGWRKGGPPPDGPPGPPPDRPPRANGGATPYGGAPGGPPGPPGGANPDNGDGPAA